MCLIDGVGDKFLIGLQLHVVLNDELRENKYVKAGFGGDKLHQDWPCTSKAAIAFSSAGPLHCRCIHHISKADDIAH